jgi:hypothetical protein
LVALWVLVLRDHQQTLRQTRLGTLPIFSNVNLI